MDSSVQQFYDDMSEYYHLILVVGGTVFTNEAPCDGEFIIYMINFCATLQNYVEISVY